MKTTAQEALHTCEHCGGEMTYAVEYRGMVSQCPHCQQQVVLGGQQRAPLATPVKKKPSKLIRYLVIVGCTLAVCVGFVVVKGLQVRSETSDALAKRGEMDKAEEKKRDAEVDAVLNKQKQTEDEIKQLTQKVRQQLEAKQARLEKKLSEQTWNTKDINALQNGNVNVAIRTINKTPDLQQQATVAQASLVARAPWKYYGKPLKFTGKVESVQDFPPDSEFVKATEGKEACEIVVVSSDGSVVDMLCMGASGNIKTGNTVNLFGYATGTMEVPNRLGGTFTHLIIVGNSFEKVPR